MRTEVRYRVNRLDALQDLDCADVIPFIVFDILAPYERLQPGALHGLTSERSQDFQRPVVEAFQLVLSHVLVEEGRNRVRGLLVGVDVNCAKRNPSLQRHILLPHNPSCIQNLYPLLLNLLEKHLRVFLPNPVIPAKRYHGLPSILPLKDGEMNLLLQPQINSEIKHHRLLPLAVDDLTSRLQNKALVTVIQAVVLDEVVGDVGGLFRAREHHRTNVFSIRAGNRNLVDHVTVD
mmetsp:Transcript_14828/g.27526  ORF Transcript_14828/g.27526 Transcript_14828/m.27526 type:complete len:234 (-) Transcript_14828:609-1310(-)